MPNHSKGEVGSMKNCIQYDSIKNHSNFSFTVVQKYYDHSGGEVGRRGGGERRNILKAPSGSNLLVIIHNSEVTLEYFHGLYQ